MRSHVFGHLSLAVLLGKSTCPKTVIFISHGLWNGGGVVTNFMIHCAQEGTWEDLVLVLLNNFHFLFTIMF